MFGYHYTVATLDNIFFLLQFTCVHKNDKCFLFVFNEAVMIFFDRIWVGSSVYLIMLGL